MSIPGIDSSHIQSMMAQLKAAATRPNSISAVSPAADSSAGASKVGFGDFLKNSLDQVNAAQQSAESLGKRFAVGDDSVNLSDVMISTQKASISFQAAVQVRNKLVSAYHDIISMQV